MAKNNRSSNNKKNTTNRSYRPKTVVMTCSSCGKQCIVPFQPDIKIDMVCLECFQKNKSQ
ncbi:CxxC-x17-CxxC domain-containing protein [Desulfocucumis palustris]|uniref:CxxC-x17-CxxC domain-containing protein n=1 Tax=Desulfocucumis palustris TaxID=1898651 RepID=UPI001A9A34C2